MMIVWLAKGQPIYPSMSYAQGQTIAYISDIGATGLKPLFIAGSTVSVVIFDLAFISERWLRHKGRLAHNTNWTQKILSICSIIAAIVGAAGLILLTIFDTLHHPHLHRVFLGLFIGGYIVSAIFICAEYQRLGVTFREYKVLRMSFWIKLFFIFAEVALVIGEYRSWPASHIGLTSAPSLRCDVLPGEIQYSCDLGMDDLPRLHLLRTILCPCKPSRSTFRRV